MGYHHTNDVTNEKAMPATPTRSPSPGLVEVIQEVEDDTIGYFNQEGPAHQTSKHSNVLSPRSYTPLSYSSEVEIILSSLTPSPQPVSVSQELSSLINRPASDKSVRTPSPSEKTINESPIPLLSIPKIPKPYDSAERLWLRGPEARPGYQGRRSRSPVDHSYSTGQILSKPTSPNDNQHVGVTPVSQTSRPPTPTPSKKLGKNTSRDDTSRKHVTDTIPGSTKGVSQHHSAHATVHSPEVRVHSPTPQTSVVKVHSSTVRPHSPETRSYSPESRSHSAQGRPNSATYSNVHVYDKESEHRSNSKGKSNVSVDINFTLRTQGIESSGSFSASAPNSEQDVDASLNNSQRNACENDWLPACSSEKTDRNTVQELQGRSSDTIPTGILGNPSHSQQSLVEESVFPEESKETGSSNDLKDAANDHSMVVLEPDSPNEWSTQQLVLDFIDMIISNAVSSMAVSFQQNEEFTEPHLPNSSYNRLTELVDTPSYERLGSTTISDPTLSEISEDIRRGEVQNVLEGSSGGSTLPKKENPSTSKDGNTGLPSTVLTFNQLERELVNGPVLEPQAHLTLSPQYSKMMYSPALTFTLPIYQCLHTVESTAVSTPISYCLVFTAALNTEGKLEVTHKADIDYAWYLRSAILEPSKEHSILGNNDDVGITGVLGTDTHRYPLIPPIKGTSVHSPPVDVTSSPSVNLSVSNQDCQLTDFNTKMCATNSPLPGIRKNKTQSSQRQDLDSRYPNVPLLPSLSGKRSGGKQGHSNFGAAEFPTCSHVSSQVIGGISANKDTSKYHQEDRKRASFHYQTKLNFKESCIKSLSQTSAIQTNLISPPNNSDGSLFLFDVQAMREKKQVNWDGIRRILHAASRRGLVGVISTCNTKIQKQILNLDVNYIITSCGRHLYRKGRGSDQTETFRQHVGDHLIQKLTNFTLCYIGWLKLPIYRGKFLEVFDTHTNISLIGKGASKKDHELFRQIDRRADVRLGFVKSLSNQFRESDLSFTLSGDYDVRVAPLGWDHGLTQTYTEDESFSEMIVFSPNCPILIEDSIANSSRPIKVKHVKAESITSLARAVEVVLSVL